MKITIHLWKARRWILVVAFLAMSIIGITQTTTLHYTIDVDGVDVGDMQATKEIDGTKTTITIKSSSSVHFLVTTVITTSLITVISDGQLKSSFYTSNKNNKPFESTTITENNGVYTIINAQGKTKTFTSPIKRVTCELYFEEPKSKELYFDVINALYNPIEQNGLNTYTYNDRTDKKETTYVYSNSKLQHGTIAFTWYKFSFILKN